jgi:MFS family permease
MTLSGRHGPPSPLACSSPLAVSSTVTVSDRHHAIEQGIADMHREDTGTISGILASPYWIRTFAKPGETTISPGEDSLIVSILSAGTFIGALLAAPLADKLGRKYGLMSSAAIVFNLGVILQTASTSQPLFIAGRFFAGLGVGLISAIVPLYQSETAPKWIRGTIVGAYQWAITIVSSFYTTTTYKSAHIDITGALPRRHRQLRHRRP